MLERAGFDVRAEARDAREAVDKALDIEPDICLLDVHMPGSGINAAARISAALPNTAVVMLTVSTDEQHVFDALSAGAAGYLLKDTDPDRLGLALRGVLAGEAALPRVLVAKLVEEFRGRQERRLLLGRKRGARLTSREWEVLELMRKGLSTAEMSKRLFVTPVTIRSHVRQILKKLRVPDRKAAIELMGRDEAPS